MDSTRPLPEADPLLPSPSARLGRVGLGCLFLAGALTLYTLWLMWGGPGNFVWANPRLGGRALSLLLPLVGGVLALGLFLTSGARGPLSIVALVGALTFVAVTANTRLIGSGDTLPASFLPFAVVRHHTLTFETSHIHNPEFDVDAPKLPYALRRVGGKVVSKYPLATGLLAIPAYLPAVLGSWSPDDSIRVLEKLAAALLTALGVMLFYAGICAAVGNVSAAWSTALYVLGTPILSIVGQALWQHTGAVLGFSLSVFGLFVPRRSIARGLLVGAGLGLAVACRQVDVILATGFFAALWLRDRASIPVALLAGGIPLGLTGLYQYEVFGSVFETGYGAEAKQFLALSSEALLGTLFSPGRGLFLHAPILLLAVGGLLLRKNALGRWPARVLAATVAVFVIVMAKWWCWDGAFSLGNRMLADTLPFLGVGLAFWVHHVRATGCHLRLTGALGVASIGMFALLTYVFPPPLTKRLVMDVPFGAWAVQSYPPVAYVLGVGAKHGL